MARNDGRQVNDLREIKFTRGWLDHAEGSVLVEFGKTRVLCVASFFPGVPRWLKDSGNGWVTSEYAMLPRATHTRSDRESVKGKLGGRTQEISRLVGRSLRAIVNMKELGENTIVAKAQGHIKATANPLSDSVAAVSVGIIDGVPMLDLCYEEDVRAETDMNVVVAGDGRFIEVQGTAEGAPFDRALLNQLLDLAVEGCATLSKLQREVLAK